MYVKLLPINAEAISETASAHKQSKGASADSDMHQARQDQATSHYKKKTETMRQLH